MDKQNEAEFFQHNNKLNKILASRLGNDNLESKVKILFKAITSLKNYMYKYFNFDVSSSMSHLIVSSEGVYLDHTSALTFAFATYGNEDNGDSIFQAMDNGSQTKHSIEGTMTKDTISLEGVYCEELNNDLFDFFEQFKLDTGKLQLYFNELEKCLSTLYEEYTKSKEMEVMSDYIN